MNLFRSALACVAFTLASWTGAHATNPCVVLSAASDIPQFSSYSEFVLRSDAEGSNLSAWSRYIRNAPRTSHFDVTGHVPTNETIIKADRVVFNQGGTLEFQNLDAEFWAIIAKTFEFNFRLRGQDTSTDPRSSEQVRIIRSAGYSIPVPKQAGDGSSGRSYHGRAPKGHTGRARSLKFHENQDIL